VQIYAKDYNKFTEENMTEPLPREDVEYYDLDQSNENQSDIYSESEGSQENDLTIDDFVDNVLKIT
jgi:hypothetical protein